MMYRLNKNERIFDVCHEEWRKHRPLQKCRVLRENKIPKYYRIKQDSYLAFLSPAAYSHSSRRAPLEAGSTACCFDGIETFDLRQNKTPGAIWHPVFQLNNRRNQTGIRGGENSKISLRGTGPAAGRWSAISAWRLPGSCRPQQRRGGRR